MSGIAVDRNHTSADKIDTIALVIVQIVSEFGSSGQTTINLLAAGKIQAYAAPLRHVLAFAPCACHAVQRTRRRRGS